LPDRPAAELRAAGHRVESLGTRWLIRVVEGHALQRALGVLTQSEVFVHSVEPRRETLEEHFVRALSRENGNGS